MSLELLQQYAEPVGLFIGFLLTLMTLSYLFGDNFLFRLAIHIFVGAASGYAVVVLVYNILWTSWVLPAIQDPMAGLPRLIVPLLLGLGLLSKLSPRLAAVGSPVLAYLVGVGAAAAVGGALLGTIFPQAAASMDLLDLHTYPPAEGQLLAALARGSVILVGTLTTLVYFQYSAQPTRSGAAKRPALIEGISQIGAIFIAIALGVLFAGVYAAALTAFIERTHYLWDFIWSTLAPIFTGS